MCIDLCWKTRWFVYTEAAARPELQRQREPLGCLWSYIDNFRLEDRTRSSASSSYSRQASLGAALRDVVFLRYTLFATRDY